MENKTASDQPNMKQSNLKDKKKTIIDKVPFREKMALGVGAFSNMFGYIGVATVARTAYIMIMGLNAAWIGVALTIPRIWDAFTDPFMGKISDNFHSRWGRRRPFIVAGAILMGIIFGLIWMVPEAWNGGSA